MNFYYWSPFLSEVATVKAVLNSAYSLSKYSKGNFKPCIINSVGEWTSFKDEIKDKQSLQKILLCDVQNQIYPKLEKSFLRMLSSSGYPDIKFNKEIDFDKLYKEKFN